jgi:hypothetical protein
MRSCATTRCCRRGRFRGVVCVGPEGERHQRASPAPAGGDCPEGCTACARWDIDISHPAHGRPRRPPTRTANVSLSSLESRLSGIRGPRNRGRSDWLLERSSVRATASEGQHHQLRARCGAPSRYRFLARLLQGPAPHSCPPPCPLKTRLNRVVLGCCLHAAIDACGPGLAVPARRHRARLQR